MAYQPYPRDASTQAILTLDYPHHELHDGNSFHAGEVQSISTTTYKWGLTTPNTTKWLHMAFAAACTGEMLFSVYENPATYSGGSAWTAINTNRNSATASGAVLLTNVTATGGTLIFQTRLGDTAGGTSADSGGDHGPRGEYILKQNEQYVFQIQTFAAAFGTIDLSWYEHTDAA